MREEEKTRWRSGGDVWIQPPKWNKKGTKQSPQKHVISVPENQLNSLHKSSTLAYLHSSQVSGFGVKQGLSKVLLFVRGLCWATSSYCATGWLVSALKVLLWFGWEQEKKVSVTSVALEQVDLQDWDAAFRKWESTKRWILKATTRGDKRKRLTGMTGQKGFRENWKTLKETGWVKKKTPETPNIKSNQNDFAPKSKFSPRILCLIEVTVSCHTEPFPSWSPLKIC